MKKLIYFLLFGSFGAYAQSGSKDATAFHSRVSDSTTVVKPAGWGTLYYNGQSSKWRATQNGLTFDLLPHFGTAQQIPFMNNTGSGFRYSSKLKWDDSYENLIAAPGVTLIGPLNKFHQNSVLGEYHTFDLSTAGFGITDLLVSGYKHYATNAGAGFIFGQGNFQIDCYGCFTGGINSALAKPVSGTSFNDAQGAFIYSFTPAPDSGTPDTTTVAPPVRGNVYGSINISRNTSSQVNGHGALGKGAVIIGGVNNHIPSNSGDNVILGGNGLSARAGENFQTYVENLNINSVPLNDDALTQVLVRNSSTGQVKYRNASSLSSSGGITNTAALNELMKSNGTNSVPSGLFSTTLGDFTLGTGAVGTMRTVTADGSAANVSFSFLPKGAGGATIWSGSQNHYMNVSGSGVALKSLDGQIQNIYSTSSTNAVKYPLELDVVSNGTPSVGIGTGVQFVTGTATGVTKTGSTIESISKNIGSTTEAFDLVFKTMTAGSPASEKFRIFSSGGFSGGGLVVNPGTTLSFGSLVYNSSSNSLNIGSGNQSLYYRFSGNDVRIDGTDATATTSFSLMTDGANSRTELYANNKLALMASGQVLFTISGGNSIGFFNTAPALQQHVSPILVNGVTSGGTISTIANYTDLTTYSNDAAAIRNNFYRLTEKVLKLESTLRAYGLAID